MLTAAHVVGSLSAAHRLGWREVRLGTSTNGVSPTDPRIGDVFESHPPEPCKEVELDACLVRVDEHVTLGGGVREKIASGLARDLEGHEELVKVFKRGINDMTPIEGLLDPTLESLKVTLPNGANPALVRHYMRGWFVHGVGGPFARSGDSGSIVVDEDDHVVAMVVALRTMHPHDPKIGDPAFVIPIMDILSGLKVQLAGPESSGLA
ncbi:MAG TPA: hypothetical protein VK781_04535 [Solirubrobacteraceae bacterium]|nr:hypothetical protein [Solirubrobacteraceae bacterium]